MVAEEAKKMAQGATGEEQKSTDITVEPNNTGNQGSAEADMERIAEAGRAARLPNYGGEEAKAAQNESNADKTFQANMERQKYAHTNDLIGRLEKERDELADNRTPEQKKKAERREKMAKIFAALGDGVAAMSNLVLASKGAVPYQSKSSLSKAVGDRYDKFRKDLEERKAKSLALSERIAQLRQGVEDRKAKDERFEYQRKRQEVEDKRKEELHGLTVAGQNLKNQYTQAQIQKIKNDDAYREKALQVKKAIAELNAMSREKAARIRGSYGGRGRTTYTTPWDGKTYSNLAEYKAAVDEAAILYDVQDYKTVNYKSGFKTNERVMPKSTAQKAAEIAQKSRQGGGSGNGNKGGKGKGY